MAANTNYPSIERGATPGFKRNLTPKQMPIVFGGKYMTDCKKEFPASWFKGARLNPKGRDPKLNLFMVEASLLLWV